MSAMATQHSIAQMTSAMPHGLGLLTTVASLPPKYRSRYLNVKTKCEIPLDLSVKPSSPLAELASDVPMASTFTEVYTEPSGEPERRDADAHESVSHVSPVVAVAGNEVFTSVPTAAIVAATHIVKPTAPPPPPMFTPTPTPTPTPNKRKHDEPADTIAAAAVVERVIVDAYTNPPKLPKTAEHPTTRRECTPSRPIKITDSAPKTVKAQPPATKSAKHKATRKLKFDEETSSPVSGTIIRPLEDITDGTVQYSNGDIDPKYNIVEITEETKAELAAIKNVIGDYVCRLCRIKFDDAFGLARHRCACIVLLEYRCPECGKQFNCPANLASHRRWHKPKKEGGNAGGGGGGGAAVAKKENRNTTNSAPDVRRLAAAAKKQEELAAYTCDECGKKFKRPAYLRKHQLTHKRSPTSASAPPPMVEAMDGGVTTSTALGSYQSYAGSSASSMHSYSGGTHEDEANAVYAAARSVGSYAGDHYRDDDDDDVSSECSTSTAGYGRLQIVESGLTEEENIAAAALTNLRNCASVIQHTTLAH